MTATSAGRKEVFVYMVAQEATGEGWRVVRRQVVSVSASGRIAVVTESGGRRTHDGSELGLSIFNSAREALTRFATQQRVAAERAALLASRGMTAVAWARREIGRLASEGDGPDVAGTDAGDPVDSAPLASGLRVGDSYALVHWPSDSFGYPILIPVTVAGVSRANNPRRVLVEIASASGGEKLRRSVPIVDLRVRRDLGVGR